MITLKDLDGLKLVAAENFADAGAVQEALEYAYAQGSQGWGVTEPTAILLSVAQALREALIVATDADDNRRMLKGAQLELGRVKKQRDALQEKLDKSE